MNSVSPGASVRLATWNLQSCRRGIAPVAEHLRSLDADVVALQEVDRGAARTGRVDQALHLARACGYAHAQFFAARPCDGGEYGVALLSRHPLRDPRARALPVPGGIEPRVLGSARVDLPGGPLSVHVTHLSHRVTEAGVRARQVAFIRAALEREGGRAVLAGDFNAAPRGTTHRAVSAWLTDAFARAGRGPAGTFPLPLPFAPAVRIDYIFTSREVRPLGARVAHTAASDHHALLADVAVGAPGGDPSA